ncbi:MAG TPA: right-handed parallel beta-helix repeat-containing protein, partial [Acidobacteriaceae bacterium]
TRSVLQGGRAVISISGASDVPVGALVCNLAGAPQLQVSESHFLGNRARGIVAHANVTITNSEFSGCSLPAILLAPDAHWMEGPAVQKVVIRDNHFSNCAYGKPDASQGVITIDTTHDARPERSGGPQVNKDIVVSGNTFDPSPAPAIYCAHASGVSLLKNTFAPRTFPITLTGRIGAMKAASPMQTAATVGDPVVIVDSDELDLKENTSTTGAVIVLSRCTGVDAASNVRLTVQRATSM